MKNKTVLFSIFIFGGLQLFSGAPRVSAQMPPAGSYRETCRKLELFTGANLLAECRQKNGDYKSSMLNHYYLCKDEITNQNGTLTCTKDSSQAIYQNALKLTESSLYEVFGDAKRGGGPEVWLDGLLGVDYYYELYRKGTLTTLQSTNYFRDDLMKPNDEATRTIVADRAIKQVYGRKTYPNERAPYEQAMKIKTTYFAKIVADETAKMNKDKALRGLMIGQVYKDSMGRPPRKEEREYWLPKTENYAQMIEANRNWLYSPSGLNDLNETVKQYYYDKNGKQPDEQTVKAWVGAFAKNGRKIYIEMNL